MKYYLSIEFYGQGEITGLKEGDIITFISFKGRIKTGTITHIKYLQNSDVPTEYSVECNGKNFIAVSDYVIRDNGKVLSLESDINELDNGFPLRT